ALVPRIVGEAADMDRRQIGQRAQLVVRTDFVAPVRRPGHAMGEEQYFSLHAGHQPSHRAIQGPITSAAALGSAFHSATLRAYCGESGLMSRGASPGAAWM